MVILATVELTLSVMVCPTRIVTVSVERGTVPTHPVPAHDDPVPQFPDATFDWHVAAFAVGARLASTNANNPAFARWPRQYFNRRFMNSPVFLRH